MTPAALTHLVVRGAADGDVAVGLVHRHGARFVEGRQRGDFPVARQHQHLRQSDGEIRVGKETRRGAHLFDGADHDQRLLFVDVHGAGLRAQSDGFSAVRTGFGSRAPRRLAQRVVYSARVDVFSEAPQAVYLVSVSGAADAVVLA